MYSTTIEKLIEHALADGELSENERKVLSNKAVAEGIDIDEFNMVLDARLHAKQQLKRDYNSKPTVTKCPSCNDIVPALSRVCPSCGFVVDATSSSKEPQRGLEDLIADIDGTLVQLKSLKRSNVLTSLLVNAHITLPILAVVFFIVGFRLLHDSGLIGLVLIVLSWIVIKKKIKAGKTENNQPSFDALKATFQKHARSAKTLFGDNKKVRLLLDELDKELVMLEAQHKSAQIVSFVIYGIMALAVVGVFFIPKKKNSFELSKELSSKESPLVMKAETLIDNNKIEEAKQVVAEVQSEESKVLIRSKIQLHLLLKQLDAIEPLLAKRNYQDVKLALAKSNWEKISTDFSTVGIERDVYKVFLKRKEAINKQLPSKFRAIIESEYSL